VVGAIALLLFCLLPTQAPAHSAKQMLKWCELAIEAKDPPDHFAEGTCYGTVDALLKLGAVLDPRMQICAPQGVTITDVVRVVVVGIKELSASPNELDKEFLLIAGAVLCHTSPYFAILGPVSRVLRMAHLRFPASRHSRLQDCRLRWRAAAELRRAASSLEFSRAGHWVLLGVLIA
jgi:hypothetical protein